MNDTNYLACCNSTDFAMGNERIAYNRIKEELANQGRKAIWLASELDVHRATVSKWCTNFSQPSVENLCRVACLLNVKPGDLINEIDCEE